MGLMMSRCLGVLLTSIEGFVLSMMTLLPSDRHFLANAVHLSIDLRESLLIHSQSA